MTEMTPTNEQLDLLLAEYLEPKSTLTSIDCADFDRGVIDEKVISALGCWYFIRDEEPFWRPRAFTGNPAMRDLLQQKLLEEGWVITLCKDPPAFGNEIFGVFDHADFDDSIKLHTTRERLWPECFARAKGLI